MAIRGPRRVQLAHRPAEGGALVAQGLQELPAYLLDQFAEGRSGGDARPYRHRVHQETGDLVGTRCQTAGQRYAQDEICFRGVAVQQRERARRQGHEHRRGVVLGGLPQQRDEVRRQVLAAGDRSAVAGGRRCPHEREPQRLGG
nr:hypothetical protein [Streptomyces sp. Wb2n-11]